MQEYFDIAIIGAGPAGISAATHAASQQLSHILFEKGEVANTIYEYQLGKHVMAEPARLPLRAKCRFAEGSREEILEQFSSDLRTHNVNVRRAEITKVVRVGEHFELYGAAGVVTARHVVLASGVQGAPRTLGVSGEQLPHVGYTLVDPKAFFGQSVVVVGAGDAAIENALALVEQNTVFLVNRGAEFARAKDANVKRVQAAISSGALRCFFNATVARIEPEHLAVNTPDGEVEVPCTRVIARLGCVPPRKFIEGMGIQFPSPEPSAVPVVNERYESNVPGLYILGALIGYPLIKQAINQGFEVIEHICGRPVQPADQPLLEERFAHLSGGCEENYPRVISSLPLFKDLSASQWRELVIDSQLHLKTAGEVIFERNDFTDTFWSVVSGEVLVEISPGRTVTLGAGQFFGEMGLMSGRRRVATVRAASPDTLLLESPRKQLLKLIASVGSVKKALDEVFIVRILQSNIFPEAHPTFLEALARPLRVRSYKKGDLLCREGEIGDTLYVIRRGSVKISRRNALGADVVQCYIAAGNYVGEMALLSDQDVARSATVTAAVGCEVIELTKADLRRLLQEFPAERARIERVAEARKIENVTTNWSESSGQLLDFMMQEGLSDAENVLLIDSDRCIACDNCEAACAATHAGHSRLDRKGGKSLAQIQIPISCRHCENPLCMLDCPPDALVRAPNGEVVIRDSCIGCGNCVSNCPYGVISLMHEQPRGWAALKAWLGLGATEDHESGRARAAKCDMCRDLRGGPACVRACPTGAAMRVNSARLVEIVRLKRGVFAES